MSEQAAIHNDTLGLISIVLTLKLCKEIVNNHDLQEEMQDMTMWILLYD